MTENTLNFKRKIVAITSTCITGWITTAIIIFYLAQYSFGLFIWLPIVMGAMSTIIYGYNNQGTKKAYRNVSFITIGFFCIGLLFFAMEGVICLLMAAPLGIFFAWIGYLVGYEVIKNKIDKNLSIIMLLISLPFVTGFEYEINNVSDIKSVVTSVEINASPEIVWKNLIQFSPLDPPKELIFKTGIAYPLNAKIEGKGVGAIRNCNFSTGSFIEPITVWDEPKLLAFDVLDQPEPMKEISPYEIHPNHLHGFFVSKHGQFKLTVLPNGHTLLEGTTWYNNNIKPNLYWIVWSNYIIHMIHERVLVHIKSESEACRNN
jgi:hypothetical protein